LSEKRKLDAKSQAKCERIHNRVYEICEYAYSIGQPIFIDAEDSWIQDAIDRLALEMMEKFNRERPIIYTTLQMYRTDRLQYLRNARRQAKADGFILAVKLVRGHIWKRSVNGRRKRISIPHTRHQGGDRRLL
jgi:proline dehydrogenase